VLKADLITEVQKDEYKSICRKLHPNLWKDLYQELIVIVLEKDEASIERIKNNNGARFYLVGILLNMVRSVTSPFYKKYRNTFELTDEVYETDDYDKEKSDKVEKLTEIIDKQYWFDKHIIKTYMEEGSLRKTAAKTGISVSIVRGSIDNVKQTIKQKMEKINILLVTNKQNSGLKYHRQLAPHARLLDTHPEFNFTKMEFEGEDKQMEASVDKLTDEYLKTFKIVYYLRQISFQPGKVKATIDRLHNLGCKVVLDIDDYWRLNAGHYMYKAYKAQNVINETEEAVRLVDHVITTTDYFAAIIEKLNPNVTVLPNCIHPEDQQFKPRNIPNERIRFGWIGGVYHKPDIDAISENFCRLVKDSEVRDKYQVCLGGYNLVKSRDGVTMPNPEYHAIETNMTCNYYEFKNYDTTYASYLFAFTPTMEHISYDKSYRRLYSKDVFTYGELYNEIDVALVPLISNEFNRCKSELKLVEAGTMGKAVIVSDTEPYTSWIKHGVNGLKVKESRNNIDWYLNIKKLIKEPNLRNDLAAGLKETIEEYFDMDTHNECRAELYKSLI
jgi:glycosyltransferase involved in cell wall biosynthesis